MSSKQKLLLRVFSEFWLNESMAASADDGSNNHAHDASPDSKSLTVLEYLAAKEGINTLDSEEELIFFPELYGICPRTRHQCLNLKRNPELRKRVECFLKKTTLPSKRNPIFSYIHEYNFVEIHLNQLNLRNEIPEKVFLCENLRVLSFNGNRLKKLSPNIGRLKKLKVLQLTDNQLDTHSLPYTLTFCRSLHTLYLDNNKMMGLPGFLLEMTNLKNIRRLSTKITLREIWSTTANSRIEEVKPATHAQFPRLVHMAAGKIIASKIDYFAIEGLSPAMQNVISRCYNECFVCGNCADPSTEIRKCTYEVNTYRYGHLGNYWTTFMHQACSTACAEELDEYSYRIEKKTEFDVLLNYSEYIRNIEESSFQTEPVKTCCVIC